MDDIYNRYEKLVDDYRQLKNESFDLSAEILDLGFIIESLKEDLSGYREEILNKDIEIIDLKFKLTQQPKEIIKQSFWQWLRNK